MMPASRIVSMITASLNEPRSYWFAPARRSSASPSTESLIATSPSRPSLAVIVLPDRPDHGASSAPSIRRTPAAHSS